jgi:hypothetical protein
MSAPSFLSVIAVADNFRPSESDERLVPWTLSSSSSSTASKTTPAAIGLLRPEIVNLLKADNSSREEHGQAPSWTFEYDGLNFDSVGSASLAAHLNTPSQRSAVIRTLCEGWRDSGLFPDIIGPRKWRSELYAVYFDPFGAHLHTGLVGKDNEDTLAGPCSNYAFSMERTTCALFGVVTYGVHMNVYEVQDGKIMIWVPRRAKTKQTHVPC